jgi:plastocyanin
MAKRLPLLMVLAVAGIVLLPGGAAAGGGCHADPSIDMTSSSKTRVAIGGCAFVDTVTYVEPGETVTWVNKDFVPHSVTGAALSWGNEKFLEQTDEVSYEFEDEGVYPYYCLLHPSMVGAVVVGDGGAPGALGAGGAAVDVDAPAAAPASSEETGAVDTGGPSGIVLALSLVAALVAAVAATRYALARRTGAPSAS